MMIVMPPHAGLPAMHIHLYKQPYFPTFSQATTAMHIHLYKQPYLPTFSQATTSVRTSQSLFDTAQHK